MKIFATIHNYGAGAPDSPMGDGDAPLFYEIPDSSISRTGQPFFVPDFSSEFRLLPTVVFRISRLGKGIAPRFAGRYIEGATMGCAAVATTLLRSLRDNGMPWTGAVAFDKSCLIGNFMPIDTFLIHREWNVKCGDNEVTYPLDMMRQNIDLLVAALSRDITIKEGDMILAALHPYGFIPRIGDKLIIENNIETGRFKILDINIR